MEWRKSRDLTKIGRRGVVDKGKKFEDVNSKLIHLKLTFHKQVIVLCALQIQTCLCFTTGGPGKEQGTNKPPPTGRVQERSKGETTSLTTSQNPSLWHSSWLNKACATRKDSESE